MYMLPLFCPSNYGIIIFIPYIYALYVIQFRALPVKTYLCYQYQYYYDPLVKTYLCYQYQYCYDPLSLSKSDIRLYSDQISVVLCPSLNRILYIWIFQGHINIVRHTTTAA